MSPASETPSASPPDNIDGSSNKKKTKKRVRAFTADERASHRVIEKQRREALNERFLDLARLLPGLAHSRRLSKSIIVHESIEYLRAQRTMCLAAANEIQTILAENLELIAEVNRWREQFHGEKGTCQPRPLGEAVVSLMKLDQDVFGTFPGGFGDNSQADGNEDQTEESHKQTQLGNGRNPTPHILPRIEEPKFPTLQTDSSHAFISNGQPPLATATDPSAGEFNPNNPLIQDPFIFVNNSYSNPLNSNHEMISTNNFGDLNMDPTLFLDYPMPFPGSDYLPGDTSHFGYTA
ncbi:hypothetical protein DL95DRAFT_146506 [Leptodontidium sp. 2 PMI_412]|nr:hypothetical protein DL95DRAFT_146506 [Leptodontidium sp. 2 PMI_412]